MKTIIIFCNFLILTLILYNILNSKTLEYFTGCDKSSSNAVHKNTSLIDNLYNKVKKIENNFNSLNLLSRINKGGISTNRQLIKGKLAEVEDEAKEMEEELDDVSKTEKKESRSLSRVGSKKIHSGRVDNTFSGGIRGSSISG